MKPKIQEHLINFHFLLIYEENIKQKQHPCNLIFLMHLLK